MDRDGFEPSFPGQWGPDAHQHAADPIHRAISPVNMAQ